ncbi:MAG: hypothetical protein HGB32_06730 [Geobacteraceae bacterium]|nr:hypothetical protein [Geobacteraceae bacterium]NTW79828.1 hypothetical protein [Geobacteraceae bacterium]
MTITIKTLICLLPIICALPAYCADVAKFKPLTELYLDANKIQLKNPEGVACGKTAVLVADTGNGRLVSYARNNNELKNGVEIKLEQVPYPIRLEATVQGKVLALDGKSRKIAFLAADGSFVSYLDYKNVPLPIDIVPRSMTVDAGDNIYVVDALGMRVIVTDQTGTFLRQFPFPKETGFISDVAVDQRGGVYILDSMKGQVYKAAPDSKLFQPFVSGLQAHIYLAVSIDTDPQGRIYLLDQNDSAVVLLGPDGSFQGRYLSYGWRAGQINYPSQACLTENGIMIIADRNNSRIQLFKVQ